MPAPDATAAVVPLVPAGNTVRAGAGGAAGAAGGVTAALVVGDTLTSHWWLNLLPLCADPRLRHYITEADVARLVRAGRLHVVPRVTPSFLVLRHGFFVDVLPAPLPTPGRPADPYVLLADVAARLQAYHPAAG